MAITIHDILQVEKDLKLDYYIVNDIPIWRIFRRYCRDKKLRNVGVNRKTLQTALYKKIYAGVRNSLLSIMDILRLLLTYKKYENVIFPFPRLYKINDLYIDKFTDPVISKSSLKYSSCLFVFSFKTHFNQNRSNAELCVHIDFLILLVFLITPFVFPFYFFSKSFSCVGKVYSIAQEYFLLNKKDLFLFHFDFIRIRISIFIWKIIFRRLAVKRLFCVVRETFKPHIIAAHKLGIPVYEFQHGAVLGNTVLYSGVYNSYIDADYVLSVGQLWSNSDFGIPTNRILNIGWAYKDVLKENLDNHIEINHVLIISSPHITDKILNIAVELSKAYPAYFFDIRCHPKEKFTQDQKDVVTGIDNLNLVDNTIESFMAIMPYRYVLGENSSVLYEAFSIGKIVGRFNYNGISIRKISIEDDSSFFYLNKVEDFAQFVQFVPTGDRNVYYSDFNPEIVNNLPIHR